jgi:hypothetical protein
MRINKLLGAVVLSLAITGVPAAAVAAERTEGDKFANNYGYGNDAGDRFAGRTPQELSTHRALASLHRHHELVIENQRTEGDKFANNYGYGTPSETVAAVERTEGDKFANNYGYGTPSETVAAVERTEGDKFANNYGYGTPSDLLVDRGQRADAARWQAQADASLAGRVADVSTAVERTEGDKFANNYGFGADDDMVVDRGQMADAARWQAQADAYLAGQVADVSTPSAPADPGLPWAAIALSGSLMALLAGATIVIVRHQQPRSII